MHEWEFEACREAGKCVCTDSQCGKFLVQHICDHTFKKYHSRALECGGGEADANQWGPEHMKHPTQGKIGEWAQKNAYGQAPTPSPSPLSTLPPTPHVDQPYMQHTPMLVRRKFNWSHQPSGCTSLDKQICYKGSNANKNHFVGLPQLSSSSQVSLGSTQPVQTAT